LVSAKSLSHMPRFTVRVELHDETDYQLLHEKMREQGFSQTIIDTTTGITYHLPTAEYNYITSRMKTKYDIMALVKRAAREMFAEKWPRWTQRKIDQQYEVLVTPTSDRLWYNLPRVDDEE
jgi:hypothetical protein